VRVFISTREYVGVAQVSMLLTGCVANDRLDQMTFIDSDAQLGFVSDDEDTDDVWTDTSRKLLTPGSLGIARS